MQKIGKTFCVWMRGRKGKRGKESLYVIICSTKLQKGLCSLFSTYTELSVVKFPIAINDHLINSFTGLISVMTSRRLCLLFHRSLSLLPFKCMPVFGHCTARVLT